jgi:hypothetical protein
MKRAGVSYRTLAEGDELAVSIGAVTHPDREALLDLLSLYAESPVGTPGPRPHR